MSADHVSVFYLLQDPQVEVDKDKVEQGYYRDEGDPPKDTIADGAAIETDCDK